MLDVVGRALRCDATIGQDDHLIGDGKGCIQIVGHQHRGEAQGIVELSNEASRCAQGDRVQTRKWLIVHDQLGIQRNGPGQGHTTRHATRNLTRTEVPGTSETHRLKLHEHDVSNHDLRKRGVLAQRKRNVVKHTQIREERSKLIEHAHLTPGRIKRLVVQTLDLLTFPRGQARIDLVLPRDQAQHRGLAASRGTHQGGDFAARNVKAHLVQNATLRIPKAHVLELNQSGSVGIKGDSHGLAMPWCSSPQGGA